jgi:DNA-directed RNA polymerase specialized sigma24 family protein
MKAAAEPTEPKGAFDRACRDVVVLLRLESQRPLDAAEDGMLEDALGQIIDSLPRLLIVEAADGVETADVLQEALAKFLTAATRGMVDPAKSPAGYLMRIAVNVVRDLGRKSQVSGPMFGAPDEEFRHPLTDISPDEFEPLMNRIDSDSDIRHALERCTEDQTVLDVVAVWLDMAESNGAPPSQRDVAAQVGISKTAVAKALQRFGEALDA